MTTTTKTIIAKNLKKGMLAEIDGKVRKVNNFIKNKHSMVVEWDKTDTGKVTFHSLTEKMQVIEN